MEVLEEVPTAEEDDQYWLEGERAGDRSEEDIGPKGKRKLPSPPRDGGPPRRDEGANPLRRAFNVVSAFGGRLQQPRRTLPQQPSHVSYIFA